MRKLVVAILCCMSVFASLPSLAAGSESRPLTANMAAGSNATTSTSTLTFIEADNNLPAIEFRIKLAEQKKLELEAKEIEQRLSANWWSGATFPQYVIAVAITSALLFGWARGYVEPILRKESDLNALVEKTLAAKNDLLKIENEKLELMRNLLQSEKSTLIGEQEQLLLERKILTLERDLLSKKRETLKNAVTGLNVAVLEASKKKSQYFSILNSDDPISSQQ